MSFTIVNKQVLAEGVKRIDVAAPNIARKVLPGQFVSVCPEENDEHIPLAVTSADPDRGFISLIFPELGGTREISEGVMPGSWERISTAMSLARVWLFQLGCTTIFWGW